VEGSVILMIYLQKKDTPPGCVTTSREKKHGIVGKEGTRSTNPGGVQKDGRLLYNTKKDLQKGLPKGEPDKTTSSKGTGKGAGRRKR